MTPAEILRHAASMVEGNRARAHGDYQKSFDLIARFWSGYLGRTISARDVCQLMVLLKIARSVTGNGGEIDHYMDEAGYAALAGALASDDG